METIEISIDTVNALQHYLFFQKICYSNCEKVFNVIHDKISHFTDKKLSETASYYDSDEIHIYENFTHDPNRILHISFNNEELSRICEEIRKIDTIISTRQYQDCQEFYKEYKNLYFDYEHKELRIIFFKAERKQKLVMLNKK